MSRLTNSLRLHVYSNCASRHVQVRSAKNSRTTTRPARPLATAIVRSQLLYCSQVWRPSFVKEVKIIEDAQRRATKFILNDYTSDYRTRLLKLPL